MSKRVPGQPHLICYTESTYRGLPLLNCSNGFVEQYLERLHSAINHTVQSYSRVFAVRVDLHFPQYYVPRQQDVFSNEYLHSFIKVLRRRLRNYKSEKQRAGCRVHSVDFEYIWTREYGPESGRPHFHLLLLFDGHAFNSLGHYSSNRESLYNRIVESWAEVLGCHVSEGGKYVHFPDDGQYLLNSGGQDLLAHLFYRASYLAKLDSKNFHDGYHVFGGSRF